MRFQRTFTDPVPKSREEGFAAAGIQPFHGRARFAGPNTLSVGADVLEGRHIVVASGARPAPLGIPGEELIAYSEGFLELEALPRSIVFAGGSYIAFEFAHLAARAGVLTMILHRGKRPLELFDADLVARLLEHTRSLGIDVQLETPVEAIEGEPRCLVVRSGPRRFETEMVVHAAGRTPDLDDLDLPAAGVEREKRGVRVNEFLQSVSNPIVYAAGDAAAGGGAPLTPVAGYQAAHRGFQPATCTSPITPAWLRPYTPSRRSRWWDCRKTPHTGRACASACTRAIARIGIPRAA
jgi:glutathione reductase (NADPH)